MSIATSMIMQKAFTSAAVQELALITNPRVVDHQSTPAAVAEADERPALPPPVRSVRSVLLHTPLSAFTCPERGVLTLNANVTAADGFKQLLSRGVQSAPVMPVPVTAPAPGTALQPLGFFELSDAVRYVVNAYDRAEAIAVVGRAYDGKLNHPAHAHADMAHKPPVAAATAAGDAAAAAAASSPGAAASLNEAIDALFADTRTGAAGTGANATVGQMCRAHPYVSLPATASVLDAAALLVGSGHRVGVTDGNGFITNIISQSDVVRFIYNNLSHIISDERERSVDAWHMGSRPVKAMECTARTIDVFRRMCDAKLTCVVLTDERGSYVDFAQPSDLKLFLSLFTTPKAAADAAAAVALAPAQALVSSAQFEAPISVVLNELRGMELQKRIVKGSGSARLPLSVSSACAPAFADVVTRLATSRSHVLCLTMRLDDIASSESDSESSVSRARAHALQVPVMMCSLGDVLRAVLRYVPPTAAEAAALKRQRAFERAAKAAEAAKAAAEAAAEADAAETAAAAAAADAAAPPTPSPTPTAAPKVQANAKAAAAGAAVAPAASAADVKHSGPTPPELNTALHTSATALAAAAQSLSVALQSNAGAQHTLPALMVSVHSAYAAVASASPVTNVKPLPPANPPQPGAAVSADPKPSQGVAYARHSSAQGRSTAYNECRHDGVSHWYTDHGQCLYAVHTCARLHPNPPACSWPDGSKFCAWDLGYAAGERIAHEAHTAAAKRARDVTNTRASVDAQLHAQQTVAHKKP